MDLEKLIGAEVTGNSGRSYNVTSKYVPIHMMMLEKAEKPSALLGEKANLFHADINGRTVLLKEVIDGSAELEFFEHINQAEFLHENMIPLEDVIEIQGKKLAVFPFISYEEGLDFSLNMDEATRYLEDNIRMSNTEVMVFSTLILDFLDYLHQNNAIYVDLKPGNILVHLSNLNLTQDSVFFNFFDFDSTLIGERDEEKDIVVYKRKFGDRFRTTLGYAAPEIIVSSNEITENADIYSFGCMMYRWFTDDYSYNIKANSLAYAIRPYTESGQIISKQEIAKQELLEDTSFWKKQGFLVPEDALKADDIPWYMKKLIASCLEINPVNRPISSKLVNNFNRINKILKVPIHLRNKRDSAVVGLSQYHYLM
ncbi:protein kinase [Candidatus Woesearchaeota archaeon]|jgi:serine/threonine protein kinase|nr:protein kinase [Candidatus Woesearchaeota archaeon]MBT5272023.1 protein kinase [Candidatus Woesearchaeota archaeon]MBT6040764.1 protein kinase [Candidatus Woesearchaeota archaeon]MBT6336716.1 protein kinase [Candidatus Woesearchaeota archaeon]MBT7927349.1 protein kinase [Candidatus Woesearchaeota archaeon]